jgi:hypothetical protein
LLDGNSRPAPTSGRGLIDNPGTSENEYTQGGDQSAQAYFETLFTRINLINNIWNSTTTTEYENTRVESESGDRFNFPRVTTTTSANPNLSTRMVYHGGFFRDIERGRRLRRSEQGLDYEYGFGSDTSDTARELSVIHEAIHAVVHGFSDELLGRVLLNRTNVTRTEGSSAINNFLRRHCGN